MRISGDIVVAITGASSGIGKALALELAGRGARLALLARRAELLQKVENEARSAGSAGVLGLACDVADRTRFQDAIDEILGRFGRIDVLVHNAGSGHFGYVEDTPEEHIRKVFEVNAFALWYGTAAALPHMRSAGRGHIITVASFAGAFAYPANAAYIAAKHAAVGFARALRAELVGSGVESSVVLPAGVMTDWASSTEGGSMLPLFEYEGRRSGEIAVERGIDLPQMPALQTPEEIAGRIAELIEHPQPELFTHPGSHELACRYLEDPEEVGKRLEPFWLASREGYEEIKGGRMKSKGQVPRGKCQGM